MRRGSALSLVIALFAVVAPSAHASYHLMKIREVFPGTAPSYNDAFVELQMYEAGQNFVAGKSLSFYTSGGANTPVFDFPSNVTNGESQRTILVGDTGVAERDFTDNALSGKPDRLDPAGGAVCFGDTSTGERVDCVAWGSFTNTSSLPVGTAAAAIPDGQSLTRSITPNCPTLLEAADDTGNSANDFALTAPGPHSNSAAPTEIACTPPETTIDKAPKGTIEKDRARIRFSSSDAGSTFACKLDKGKYKSCTSPKTYRNLDDGGHKIRVRATDPDGNTDPTPAKARFKVDTA